MDNEGNSAQSAWKGHFVKVLNFFMAIVFYGMVALVFINAVLRYIFNSGWPASEEISRFLFVWISMLGAVIAYSQNKHVGVDLVTSKLRGNALHVVTVIGYIFILGILSLLLYGGWNYFMVVRSTPAPATGLPMGLMALGLLVCAGGMLFITLQRLVLELKTKGKKGE